MAVETQHPSLTSVIVGDEVVNLRNSDNIISVLPILEEFRNNPQGRASAQSWYSLTLEEYYCLLDILPDLKDLRNIWGRNRYGIITSLKYQSTN